MMQEGVKNSEKPYCEKTNKQKPFTWFNVEFSLHVFQVSLDQVNYIRDLRVQPGDQ